MKFTKKMQKHWRTISKTVASLSHGKPQASTSKSVKPEFKKPILRPFRKRNHNLLTPRKPLVSQEAVSLGVLPEETEVAPLEEVPSLKRNFYVLPPLPCPQSQIPVGGWLAHFAPNQHEITNNKWALSIVERGYKMLFKEIPPPSKDPIFFQQAKKPELEEEINILLQKRAVEAWTILVEGYQRNILPNYIEIGPVIFDEKFFVSFGYYGNQNPAWIPDLWIIFSQYHTRIFPVKFG